MFNFNNGNKRGRKAGGRGKKGGQANTDSDETSNNSSAKIIENKKFKAPEKMV